MNNLNIYFSDDSELAEYEAINKGYRMDVYVKIDKDIYNLHVYTLIRLQQDFEEEYTVEGFFSTEPNLVLVKDSNKMDILNTLNKLLTQGFYEKLKPMDQHIDITQFVKVQ